MKWPFKMTLTRRIWLSFAFLEFVIGMIMIVVYPYSIQSTLKENTFRTIEVQQLLNFQSLAGVGGYGVDNPGTTVNERNATSSIWTVVVDNKYRRVLGRSPENEAIFKQMIGEVRQQRSKLARYELKKGDKTLYYVVRRFKLNSIDGYLISYVWDTYTNELRDDLWNRMIFVFILASIFSLFLAFWLARYLKKPLDILGRRFKEISRLNWEKPFEWKGDKEYEQLSAQFEEMRLNLIKYDQSQKVFLQQASHELKTPIMVIQSYAQSVKDGIYPKGSLDDSMDVIIQETGQMEKRVRKLLYFTRFDSLDDKQMRRVLIRFGDLAERVRKRFVTQRADITIGIGGEDAMIYADPEQIQIILENLVENALRYAKHHLWLEAETRSRYALIRVRNDGPQIPEEERAALFEPFQKGEKGQFGLGLAIVKRIVQRHHGMIQVENRENGVVFAIRLPAPLRREQDKPSDKEG